MHQNAIVESVTKRKQNVFFTCVLLFVDVSPPTVIYLNVAQRWAAPTFPQCMALWEESVHPQHKIQNSIIFSLVWVHLI